MHKDQTPRELLEHRLEAKKAEIFDRVSRLRQEITKNPVTEFARENPLAAVVAAAIVGTLVGLAVRRRDRAAGGIDLDALAESVSGHVHERLQHDRLLGGTSISESELRSLIRENIPSAIHDLEQHATRPSFFGMILATIGRHLLMEGTAYLLGQFSGTSHPATRDTAPE